MSVKHRVSFFNELVNSEKTVSPGEKPDMKPAPAPRKIAKVPEKEADNRALDKNDLINLTDDENTYELFINHMIDICEKRPPDNASGPNPYPTFSSLYDQSQINDITTPQIIHEIIKADKVYTTELWTMVNNYLPYIQEHIKSKLKSKIPALFQNLERLYLEAMQFLKLMEQNKHEAEKVILLFSKSGSLFDSYVQYIRNTASADWFFKEVVEIISECSRNLKDSQTFHSRLMAPFQHLGNYIFLLGKIETNFQTIGKDPTKITMAIDVIKHTINNASDLMVTDSIEKSQIDLTKQGSLLKKALFDVTRSGREAPYMVFIFEKNVVFTQESRVSKVKKFTYIDSIKLCDVTLSKNDNDFLIFHITSFPKFKETNSLVTATYVLQATTPSVKNEWIRLIEGQQQHPDNIRN